MSQSNVAQQSDHWDHHTFTFTSICLWWDHPPPPPPPHPHYVGLIRRRTSCVAVNNQRLLHTGLTPQAVAEHNAAFRDDRQKTKTSWCHFLHQYSILIFWLSSSSITWGISCAVLIESSPTLNCDLCTRRSTRHVPHSLRPVSWYERSGQIQPFFS